MGHGYCHKIKKRVMREGQKEDGENKESEGKERGRG